MKAPTDLDQRCINTIRTLAIDAIEKARSGHPGMPMGTAPLAYVLWTRFMRHHPSNPGWINRDRFVLSAGHGSMLLYALLHLSGYDVSLDDIKDFRQLHSKTPGHPEYGDTPGVETTTGPLGQGFGNGVGMAVAQKHLASRFQTDDFNPVDYRIYGIVSDGDLMEGVQAEAASLAGHLKLDNLIYFYDDNRITIDGSTDLTFSEDVAGRFTSYGWKVLRADGNDLASIDSAISACLEDPEEKPCLIITRTNIGYGSPNKQDTAGVHGSPLGPDEIRLTRKTYGFDPEDEFHIADEVRRHFAAVAEQGADREKKWQQNLEAWGERHPALYREYMDFAEGRFEPEWEKILPIFSTDSGKMATRQASGKVLERLIDAIPWLLGGSADLTPSNNTHVKTMKDFSSGHYSGRYIRYGIREHGMGAIMNGMALSGLRPYGGTFLVFSDYMRPSIRLAALMGIPVTYVFTHDSIGLGEDGPTHQPVEQLAALRAIPGLRVVRPADANETSRAWQLAMEHREGPTAIVLTRQGLPVIDRKQYAPADEVLRGGYVLAGDEKDQVILIATGSEVHLALAAREKMLEKHIHARVVNLASWEVFESQPESYRNTVLPPEMTRRVCIEAGVALGWHKYAGTEGRIISLERFGLSAPADEAFRELGFTVERVVEEALSLI